MHISEGILSGPVLLSGAALAVANKSLQRTFDPLPIFADAKAGIASNAAELRRYAPQDRREIARGIR